MLDRFGRPLTGLRISLTNDCNLNCFYCHREGCLMGERQMLPDEIGRIAEIAAEFGVKRVKLTGGEPLLRPDITDVVAAVARVPVEEVSMSTNGTLLADAAYDLADAGLARVNLSIDTLDPETYASITGKNMLADALAGLDAALDAGLKPVKLNMVVLAGINEDEIEQMIAYASRKGAILQLIEFLKMPNGGQNFTRYHRDLSDVERWLSERATAVQTRQSMHARKKYILPGGEAEVVRPMHNSEFCMHCTRLRLTPDGYLKPCLMRNDGLVDVLSHVREGTFDKARTAFKEAVLRREPYFKILSSRVAPLVK
ncbi:MAG: cyclic pyranopterin phosphate synthase MoaA [Hadesarchaea archaeon DG-33-1]|nr:MAG: cyclic pyranopterin phosphate synthase MoaA [Hadesarchaea archaeon DG-33-1]